ncbi:unnamed protein product [Caretta caretta]
MRSEKRRSQKSRFKSGPLTSDLWLRVPPRPAPLKNVYRDASSDAWISSGRHCFPVELKEGSPAPCHLANQSGGWG